MTAVAAPSVPAPGVSRPRPRVGGKFLFAGEEKLWVRGVTYGAFRPNLDGEPFPARDVVERDFTSMIDAGVNAVRTFTVPPRWLLDLAVDAGLRVMVGIAWEQHVAFLEGRGRTRDIERRVRAGVRVCAGHPALLAYAVGNEIPAGIVRWTGRRRVARFLRRLYEAAKAEDPTGLVTYVNYPSTEYLRLPFLDFVCFNIYLESAERLTAYLARLHNLAGHRPLLLGELGLDSRRHGQERQARRLAEQVRAAYAAGCGGAFVFSWTDEWHRGGVEIEDWEFGLTTRDRRPKPALAAVRWAYDEAPFPPETAWPRVSVVVCIYNGESTVHDCLEGLSRLDYPDFEVIVVDDGSTDRTAAVAEEFGYRLIRTHNRGLSAARNTGIEAATGEIVAFIDGDASPDPHWLSYLALALSGGEYAGVGGPNIPLRANGAVADCVADAPGGPVHVLLSDTEAEHIPGCNMAFWKDALQEIGGFDPRFRVAGDDVDLCWRILERGWKLGFQPAAAVWHHQRDSVVAYWKQQRGYGAAEALLEAKWPEKYNLAGHATWGGRVYGHGLLRKLASRRRVYHGTWGEAGYQSLEEAPSGPVAGVWEAAAMPEWYLLLAGLALLSLLGTLWSPLLLCLPLLALAAGTSLLRAWAGVVGGRRREGSVPALLRWRQRALTALLHLLQPAARLRGRFLHGLTPWRSRVAELFAWPARRSLEIWRERPESLAATLESAESQIRRAGVAVIRAGPYDSWDLELRGGLLGVVRWRSCLEEHGRGRQLLRVRLEPETSSAGGLLVILPTLLAMLAALDGAAAASLALVGLAAAAAARIVLECGRAQAVAERAVAGIRSRAAAGRSGPAFSLSPDGIAPRRPGGGGSIDRSRRGELQRPELGRRSVGARP